MIILLKCLKYGLDLFQVYFQLTFLVCLTEGEYKKIPFSKAIGPVLMVWLPWMIKCEFATSFIELSVPMLGIQLIATGIAVKKFTGTKFWKGMAAYIHVLILTLPPELISILSVSFIGRTLNEYYYIATLNSILTLPYLMIVLFIFKKHEAVLKLWSRIHNKTIYITLSLLITMWGISFFKSFKGYSEVLNIQYDIFSPILMLGLILTFTYVINKLRSVNGQLEEQVAYLNTYTKTVESLYDNISMYKHDLSNMMLSMRHMIDSEDSNALKNIIYTDLVNIDGFNINMYTTLIDLELLNVDALKGLLLSKYQKALAVKVSLDISINNSIDKIEMSDTDVCRAVGILLDNAIEAAQLSIEKQVHVALQKSNSDLNIVIKNTHSNEQLVEQSSRFWKSTKGSGRGLGLKSLKSVLSYYPNTELKTYVDQKSTTQTIIVSL